MTDSQDFDDTDKSRSQKKRESTALQNCGKELTELSPVTIRKLPLSPDLFTALDEWRSLKSHEAKRRHMQYIGRLMREQNNPEEVLTALENIRSNYRGDVNHFKHLETLRDTLITPDAEARSAALEQVLVDFPTLERKKTNHLVEAALADREKKRPPKHARELFRLLRQADEAKG